MVTSRDLNGVKLEVNLVPIMGNLSRQRKV